MSCSGWLLLNKPSGISSAAALIPIKRIAKPFKVGHAGTLDPFATGLLIVGVGTATKLIEFVMQKDKLYEFTIKWGEQTNTDDSTGTTITTSRNRPTQQEVLRILPRFIGEISQLPPNYSAIMVGGQRAYKLARAGMDFSLLPRKVQCFDIKLLQHTNESSNFLLKCGKGFYVRALGRDIASALNTVAHISRLERKKIGKFSVDSSVAIEYTSCKASLATMLVKTHTVLEGIMKFVSVSESMAMNLIYGRPVEIIGEEDGIVAAMHDEQLIAICVSRKNILQVRKLISSNLIKQS